MARLYSRPTVSSSCTSCTMDEPNVTNTANRPCYGLGSSGTEYHVPAGFDPQTVHLVASRQNLCLTNIFTHNNNNNNNNNNNRSVGLGIESRWGWDFPHPSRLAMGPKQPPIQWAPGLSPEGKAAGGVTLTTHPPSSGAQPLLSLWAYMNSSIVNFNCSLCSPTPPTSLSSSLARSLISNSIYYPPFIFTIYSWSPRTMEPTLSSETSAFILQTPGKFPKEHRLHSKHGESLRTLIGLLG